MAGAKIGSKTATIAKSTKVEVAETSTEIVAEKEAREGLEIVNDSTAKVYLKLGAAAALHEGLYLAPGGSWDGRVGPIVWYGSVFGIATAAASVVTVSEV